MLKVGRWQLHERIGAGRLAHVHRGEGPDGEVAVKLLAPDAALDDPAAAARFQREVEALARIRHPGVIALVEHGVDPDLGPYLVTPLIRGRTLRALIAAGPTEPALAALAAREIASALAAIHAAGLVHRDLKPENVLVRDDGAVVVIDLGLAWAAHQTRYTEEGAVAGSVPYMAPEQIEGRDASPATDVWALGVILHEWIAGARPFARAQPSEEVAAILAGARPSIAARDPRVPADLVALIDACLSADRPADGAALHARLAALAPGDAAAALRDPAGFVAAEAERQVRGLAAEARRLLADGRPFAAAPLLERAARHRPGDPEILALADEVGRAPPPRKRPRWPFAVAAVVALAALAVISFLALRDRGGGPARAAAPPDAGPPPPLTAAELPEQAKVDENTLDVFLWHRSEAVLPPDPRDATQYRGFLGSREQEVATAADPAEPLAYARQMYGNSTREGEAERVLTTALTRFPDHAPLWLLRGQASTRLGRWDEAQSALDRALALDPKLADIYVARATLQHVQGRLRAAFTETTAGLAVAPDAPDLLIELVSLYVAAGRARDARPLAERATQLASDDADAWIALADTANDDAAFEHLARAVRLDTDSADAWKRLCLIDTRQDRKEAEHDCFEARLKWSSADLDLVLAESARRERAGDLEGARGAIWGSAYYDTSPRLLRRAAELMDKLGDTYGATEARQAACHLGDLTSCVRAVSPAIGE